MIGRRDAWNMRVRKDNRPPFFARAARQSERDAAPAERTIVLLQT
jgi:hypothetical protein